MFEFLNQNQMYIVLTVVLLIWAGIVWYYSDWIKKIGLLENKLKKD